MPGFQGVTAEVRLELYIIFKGLIGRREGHRGEKLNRQTTKQNQKEGEKSCRNKKRGQETMTEKGVTEKEKIGLKV